MATLPALGGGEVVGGRTQGWLAVLEGRCLHLMRIFEVLGKTLAFQPCLDSVKEKGR